jgi:hypothetical protein
MSQRERSEIRRFRWDEVMIKGPPLSPVRLPAEVTHEAAAGLAVAERWDVVRTQIALGRRGTRVRLYSLKVLNVHVPRESVYAGRWKLALVETLGAVDGGGLLVLPRMDAVHLQAFRAEGVETGEDTRVAVAVNT